ncbi:hypothetical protein D3C81_1741880 [compost metagenome]
MQLKRVGRNGGSVVLSLFILLELDVVAFLVHLEFSDVEFALLVVQSLGIVLIEAVGGFIVQVRVEN